MLSGSPDQVVPEKRPLLPAFLREKSKPCLWYQVDTLDGDPATFIYYFGQAAASLLVSPDPPLPMLTPEYLPNIDVFILRYFETLYPADRAQFLVGL